MLFEGKRVLVTGGTGSLGKELVSRMLGGSDGLPEKVIVFSRDEAKQHQMRLEWKQQAYATDEVIYRDLSDVLEFQIGDVRDIESLRVALRGVDIVINAAALKQVPTCEYFPMDAVRTNVEGAQNLVNAVLHSSKRVESVLCISTDKACKPVNVMGMTKAIQERIFIKSNLLCPQTRFICVRYGNVLASRGSVIPLFHYQIRRGGPVTITTPEMTRFMMNLGDAVETVAAALREALPGETFVPKKRSARVIDIADALIGNRKIEKKITGVRPGEKTHEVLVSEEERFRTVDRGDFLAIQPVLPELRRVEIGEPVLDGEYTSSQNLMTLEEVKEYLASAKLMVDDAHLETEEPFR